MFENRKGAVAFEVHHVGGSRATLDRPSLEDATSSPQRELVRILIANGLYPKEAEAMVDTWSDSWFEEGARLLYIVPRQAVDEIVPLTIAPAPSDVARVFVGRMELVTPVTRREVRQALATGDRDTLAKYGRFLQPIGERVVQDASPIDRPLLGERLAGRHGGVDDSEIFLPVAGRLTPPVVSRSNKAGGAIAGNPRSAGRSSPASSPTDGYRADGSFAVARCSTASRRRHSGPAGLRLHGSFRIAINSSLWVRPRNGRRPVTASAAITPSAKMSLRSSMCPAVSCSGAIYPAVPITTPGWVRPAGSWSSSVVSFASPKSSTFTTPAPAVGVVTRTLSGLRSRCTIPCACAAATAEQICSNHSAIVCGSRRP